MSVDLPTSSECLFRLGAHILRLVDYQNHPLLSEFADKLKPYASVSKHDDDVDIVLSYGANGLECLWNQGKKKPLLLSIDVAKFIKQQKTFPAAKQGALNQALGRKTKSIIDATGGWGGDALLFCSQGYDVTVLERNPLMAVLLRDAMRRLASSAWATSADIMVPKVIATDAGEFFTNDNVDLLKSVDCVYLDPMFPTKPKASAAVNKRIQFLQYLVGADVDAELVAQAIVSRGARRVVVKRPHHAAPLIRKPDAQFASKLVHYDVYVANNLDHWSSGS